MEAVLPAIIGAIATIVAALIQLAMGWRKEMSARDGHSPVLNKRTRRGMVFAVFILMIGSAVGGFSLSQYLVGEARREAEELDRETRARIEQLSAIAERLERSAGLKAPPAGTSAAAPLAPAPALPEPICLEGNPPVEKPCTQIGQAAGNPSNGSTTAVNAPAQ